MNRVDTLQNSPSAFRELRLAAGATLTSIAEDFGITREQVKKWNRGAARPRWRHMPGLARRFRITLAEAVRLFWGEIVGGLCACGCSGEKILPTDDGAQILPVSLACGGCGAPPRIFHPREKHPKLCRDCSFAGRGKALPRPSFPVTCVGYKLPGMTVPRFKCPDPHQRRVRPSQLKNYPGSKILRSGRTSDDGVHAFVNEVEGKYRCSKCAGVIALFRAREKRVREFWAKAKPAENIPVIRNAAQLKALEKRCLELSYKDESGAIVTFNPDLDRGRRKKKKTWPLRGRPVQREHRLKLQFKSRRKVLPATVKGFCLIPGCDKLVLRPGKTPRYVHLKCFNEWQRERGLNGKYNNLTLLIKRRRGRRVNLEKLRRDYDWTKRYQLGESFGDIARTSGLAKNAVVKGFKRIMDHRPEVDLVPKILHEQVSLLWSPRMPI
jgi:transcriptional regulator with XRE-family HTH domain